MFMMVTCDLLPAALPARIALHRLLFCARCKPEGLNLQCSYRHMASGPALHSRASCSPASVHSRASDPILHNTAPAFVGLAV